MWADMFTSYAYTITTRAISFHRLEERGRPEVMVATRSHQTKIDTFVKNEEREQVSHKRSPSPQPRATKRVKGSSAPAEPKNGSEANERPKTDEESVTKEKQTSDKEDSSQSPPLATDDRAKAEDKSETKKERDTTNATIPQDTKEEEKKPAITRLKRHDDTDQNSKPININRAPVLHLYASCAAQFEHPDYSWPTCLSIGSAISNICALSKGRAIGEIPENQDDHGRPVHLYDDKIEVMGFQVPMRGDAALVGDQKKTPNEGYLKSKFGERYGEVKDVMNEALQTWKGHEEDFKKRGFYLYEQFRPASGQWGAQGGLDVGMVRRVITR